MENDLETLFEALRNDTFRVTHMMAIHAASVRLRTQVPAAMEIVRRVADMPTEGIDPTAPYRVLVEDARDLLASE